MRIRQFFSDLYIFIMINFFRDKVKKSLSLRKEKGLPNCQDCGLCCKHCVAYDHETGLCRIWYDADYRCKKYPLFPFQIKRFGDKCRYYWENENK